MTHHDKAELGLAVLLLLAILVSFYRTTGQRAAKLAPGKLASIRWGSRAAVSSVLLIAIRILTH